MCGAGGRTRALGARVARSAERGPGWAGVSPRCPGPGPGFAVPPGLVLRRRSPPPSGAQLCPMRGHFSRARAPGPELEPRAAPGPAAAPQGALPALGPRSCILALTAASHTPRGRVARTRARPGCPVGPTHPAQPRTPSSTTSARLRCRSFPAPPARAAASSSRCQELERSLCTPPGIGVPVLGSREPSTLAARPGLGGVVAECGVAPAARGAALVRCASSGDARCQLRGWRQIVLEC